MYLNETLIRALKAATLPFSSFMSSSEISAILRSFRLLDAVSTAVFAASSQDFGLDLQFENYR